MNNTDAHTDPHKDLPTDPPPHTGTQTNRHTHKLIHTHTGTQAHRQTDTHTHSYTQKNLSQLCNNSKVKVGVVGTLVCETTRHSEVVHCAAPTHNRSPAVYSTMCSTHTQLLTGGAQYNVQHPHSTAHQWCTVQ